ncbi:Eukaryotic translation initiation factor 3 subunit G [Larimichthys crocea]|uniref:Eukaryotic translation initiation factor 3 subunit G n=3 Tax=Sciaenidae TaxID=30870 RepID=A0A6G0HWI1_LARCR|nr:Eukaryotic translation initiation factor 3 subunit G [Larimichthys crocea]
MALLPSVYGIEFIVALAGNLFALWLLVVRERRNWHTGVVLSCNLAISDLLYVLTLPLLIVYYSLEKNWIFGDAVCKIERFLFTCNLYVSIFFIMAISVNRCVALVWPFFTRSHVKPAHAKAVSVIIWITLAERMPSIEYDDSKPSWADQVEEEGDEGTLPSPKETIKGNIKTITEYKIDDDGKKFKIVRTFKIETRKASKAVARRKNWKKFGNSEFDAPGPNVATTTVSDDVFMTFISSKEDLNAQDQDEDPMNKLKGQKIVSCRICKGDHWTTRCPYKDTLGPMQKELAEQLGLSTADKEKPAGSAEPEPAQPAQSKTGKYVPPSLRDGGTRRGESMQPNRRGGSDDNATIRVTNLSEDTRETDLQELFRPFGSISRIYLAKDKNTGQSKGFAFISFHRREDAARAIAGVSGFGYDHLILNVEWAKPSNN